jgi:hypothetical protein
MGFRVMTCDSEPEKANLTRYHNGAVLYVPVIHPNFCGAAGWSLVAAVTGSGPRRCTYLDLQDPIKVWWGTTFQRFIESRLVWRWIKILKNADHRHVSRWLSSTLNLRDICFCISKIHQSESPVPQRVSLANSFVVTCHWAVGHDKTFLCPKHVMGDHGTALSIWHAAYIFYPKRLKPKYIR